MGNLMSEPVYTNVLLLGESDQGKTRFLYEGLLKGKFNDGLRPSQGYNVETFKPENESVEYAIWDLAASPEFKELHAVFFKFIPFKMTIYIVRKQAYEKEAKAVAETRKMIHTNNQDPAFKGKPIALVINCPPSEIQDSKEQIQQEMLLQLKWDEIDLPKHVCMIDVRNDSETIAALKEIHVFFKECQEKHESNT